MTNAGFWKTDWFLGAGAVICVALLNRMINRMSDPIPSLEPTPVALADKAPAEDAYQGYQPGDENAARSVRRSAAVSSWKSVSRMRAAWI